MFWPASRSLVTLRGDRVLAAAEERALLANPWFGALAPELQCAMLRESAVWHVPVRHKLCSQGAVPDVWFGLAAGAVHLCATSEAGHETTLDLLEPGQWFGDMALLDAQPLPYAAQTWAASTLLVMRRSSLRQLLAQHPAMGTALARLNAQRNLRLLQRLGEQAEPLLHLRARRMLRVLAQRFGVRVPGGWRIALPLTQAQLAQLMDASRQRVNEILGVLEREAAVRVERRSVVVRYD
jgi:CRP-like cAMP-binding protein